MFFRNQLVLAALAFSAAASAQIINMGVLDSFQVGYAADLNNGDSVINLTNDGALEPTGSGNLCVNIYAFDSVEELLACCACMITPNGLASLSVNESLRSNTAGGEKPPSMVIELVATSTAGAPCDPTNVTAAQLAPGLRAWGTTLHALPGGRYGVTERAFSRTGLGATELAQLKSFCSFIVSDGTGSGICKGCSSGGQ
jgi:hypothetical protein